MLLIVSSGFGTWRWSVFAVAAVVLTLAGAELGLPSLGIDNGAAWLGCAAGVAAKHADFCETVSLIASCSSQSRVIRSSNPRANARWLIASRKERHNSRHALCGWSCLFDMEIYIQDIEDQQIFRMSRRAEQVSDQRVEPMAINPRK